MSHPLKHPPQFTADIVDDARQRLVDLLDDLKRLTTEHRDDIEVWGSAVTTAGWEIAALGQWLGLEGEATLLLGGASYPDIAEHQGTSQSNVYNRVGRSLTLAPYAKAAGNASRVPSEGLDEARRDYAADDPTEADGESTSVGRSLGQRILVVLADGPLGTTDIIAALEASGASYRRSSVLSTLSRLAHEGALSRIGHGTYAVA